VGRRPATRISGSAAAATTAPPCLPIAGRILATRRDTGTTASDLGSGGNSGSYTGTYSLATPGHLDGDADSGTAVTSGYVNISGGTFYLSGYLAFTAETWASGADNSAGSLALLSKWDATNGIGMWAAAFPSSNFIDFTLQGWYGYSRYRVNVSSFDWTAATSTSSATTAPPRTGCRSTSTAPPSQAATSTPASPAPPATACQRRSDSPPGGRQRPLRRHQCLPVRPHLNPDQRALPCRRLHQHLRRHQLHLPAAGRRQGQAGPCRSHGNQRLRRADVLLAADPQDHLRRPADDHAA